MRRIAHISDLHFGAEDPLVAEGLLDDLEQDRAARLTEAAASVPTPDDELVRHSPEPERGE